MRRAYVGDELIVEFTFDAPFTMRDELHCCDNPSCGAYTDDMCRTLIDIQWVEAVLRHTDRHGWPSWMTPEESTFPRDIEADTWQMMRIAANSWREVRARLLICNMGTLSTREQRKFSPKECLCTASCEPHLHEAPGEILCFHDGETDHSHCPNNYWEI